MAKETFTKAGTARTELEGAWQDRLAEAEALFAAGRYAGAIAAGLYAVEILLKVLICKRLDVLHLPTAFEIHDLESLLLLAGLSRRIERLSAARVKSNWDAVVLQSRELNDLRYRPERKWTQDQAVALLTQLKDQPNGVLPWILRQR